MITNFNKYKLNKELKMVSANATKYMWYMRTKDFNEISFYRDHQNEINPLYSISDFDGGDYWIIDCLDQTNGFYPEFPEDDSFCMIPKKDVINVWCEDLELRKSANKYNL